MLVFSGSIEFLDVRKHLLVHLARPHHEDGHVCDLCDDASICNDVDRRTVYEDIIIVFAHLRYHLLEPVGKQELGRVRRKSSHWKEEEVLRELIHIASVVVHLAVEICCNSSVHHIESLAEGGLSEVEVHHEDFGPLSAMLDARFITENVLPAAGLKDVNMRTWESLFLPIIRSTLVLRTRKASFIMSRLPCSTMILFIWESAAPFLLRRLNILNLSSGFT